MKMILVAVIAVSFVLSSPISIAQTRAEWNADTRVNRLMKATEWAKSWADGSGKNYDKYKLILLGIDLEKCVSLTISKTRSQNIKIGKVSNLAALCIVSMGWR